MTSIYLISIEEELKLLKSEIKELFIDHDFPLLFSLKLIFKRIKAIPFNVKKKVLDYKEAKEASACAALFNFLRTPEEIAARNKRIKGGN